MPSRPHGAATAGDTTRERAILSAATQLFHERGFHQVGVDGIGELAGISGPAIYRHFGGKDEILAALFDAAIDRLLLLCGQLPGEPFAALQTLIEAHAEFAVTDRALLSVYAREERSLAEPWRRGLQRRQRQHLDRWLRVLGRCYPDRTPAEREAAAHAAIGMVHSVAGWPRSAREGLDLAPTLVSFVRGGLLTLGPWAGPVSRSRSGSDPGRPVIVR
jgi:AcrR family transcriptional regulator